MELVLTCDMSILSESILILQVFQVFQIFQVMVNFNFSIYRIRAHKKNASSSPLYVVLIGLVGLVRGLDVVAFPHHGDVTLYVAFTSRCYVGRIRQDGPLVVKLML